MNSEQDTSEIFRFKAQLPLPISAFAYHIALHFVKAYLGCSKRELSSSKMERKRKPNLDVATRRSQTPIAVSMQYKLLGSSGPSVKLTESIGYLLSLGIHLFFLSGTQF